MSKNDYKNEGRKVLQGDQNQCLRSHHPYSHEITRARTYEHEKAHSPTLVEKNIYKKSLSLHEKSQTSQNSLRFPTGCTGG